MVFCWMVGGNLLTHFSPEVLEGCQQQNKKLNATYLMQPLDVAFSKPLKQAWCKPNCVKNLESGFRTCGIYPLNPQPSLLKLPTKEIIPEKQLWQRSQGLWWESQ